MPPSYADAFPSAEEVQIVRDWIVCGAADFDQFEEERFFISNADVFDIVLADLNSLSTEDQKNVRYLSLVHLYNGGVSSDTIHKYRKGISKLMNSMSWNEDIVRPEMIGDDKLLLRVDLRDYAWESKEGSPVSKWEVMLKKYPYGQHDHLTYSANFDQDFVNIQDKTVSRIPIVFADWFVQGVALPPRGLVPALAALAPSTTIVAVYDMMKACPRV